MKKEIIEEMAREFFYDLKEHVVKPAFKTVAYATAGNLSYNIRKKIENSLGEEWFNSSNSFIASIYTNLLLYTWIGAEIGNIIGNGQDPTSIKWGAMAGLACNLPEVIVRAKKKSSFDKIANHERGPSLPGKIISIPIEYVFGLYDKAKSKQNLENKVK